VKITCLHGYFIVNETNEGEIARFNSRYGMDLTAKDSYYTFDAIKNAPEYSILGAPYLNLAATKTYSDKVWNIFHQNGFIYDFQLKVLRPIASITNTIKLSRMYSYWYSNANGLILPGSITNESKKVTGYQCYFDFRTLNFFYSELFYA
jgi:hypothetical protein